MLGHAARRTVTPAADGLAAMVKVTILPLGPGRPGPELREVRV